MKIVLEKVTETSEGIYSVQISPADVRLLGGNSPTGEKSVLVATSFQKNGSQLLIDSQGLRVLQTGTSPSAYLLTEKVEAPRGAASLAVHGDTRFLESVPTPLRPLAYALIERIRNHFPGELQFYKKSGRYVEAPRNFWTVKAQPRDKSLRITVKGEPGTFKTQLKNIQLQNDQRSYSTFKIKRIEELNEAVSIIREAAGK